VRKHIQGLFTGKHILCSVTLAEKFFTNSPAQIFFIIDYKNVGFHCVTISGLNVGKAHCYARAALRSITKNECAVMLFNDALAYGQAQP